MEDIYLGLAIIAGLAAILFRIAVWVARHLPRPLGNLAGVLCVIAMFAYILLLWDNVRLVRLLPFSNLIVLGNWLPLAGSFLAGLAYGRMRYRAFRRRLVVSSLLLTGAYSAVAPFLGSPPDCDRLWESEDFCLQTTRKTCTAACAASLLRKYGIAATEQEMAQLCFTRRGTNWQGLYRGLKLKTADSPWDVEVVACDLDQLERLADRPMILRVGLKSNEEVDSSYETEWGWIPGVGHSVILLGISEQGFAEIADPTPQVGRETWTRENLRVLWRGHAVRFVRRAREERVARHWPACLTNW